MKANFLIACAAALAVATSAAAQPYPAKPVRIVVPYTAGGPADALVRGLGQKLSDKWGQQVIVDNRPGANEIVAADLVAKAPPEGYTFLLASDAVFTLNQYLYSKLSYDPVKDFVPVGRLVTANLMLVTRPLAIASLVRASATIFGSSAQSTSSTRNGTFGFEKPPMLGRPMVRVRPLSDQS